mmetsp:Transcript_8555/g.28181  ORF Transcript_8555/g.28181 Transcript_8555/m.28181 type:complete len:282 (-) Transcript_8555:1265-2110(-)
MALGCWWAPRRARCCSSTTRPRRTHLRPPSCCKATPSRRRLIRLVGGPAAQPPRLRWPPIHRSLSSRRRRRMRACGCGRRGTARCWPCARCPPRRQRSHSLPLRTFWRWRWPAAPCLRWRLTLLLSAVWRSWMRRPRARHGAWPSLPTGRLWPSGPTPGRSSCTIRRAALSSAWACCAATRRRWCPSIGPRAGASCSPTRPRTSCSSGRHARVASWPPRRPGLSAGPRPPAAPHGRCWARLRGPPTPTASPPRAAPAAARLWPSVTRTAASHSTRTRARRT